MSDDPSPGRDRLASILGRAYATSPTDKDGLELGRLTAEDMAQRFHANEMQTREGRTRAADYFRSMANEMPGLTSGLRDELRAFAGDLERGRFDL